MALVNLARSSFSIVKNAFFSTSIRSISTTNPLKIKQIQEHKEGNKLIIEAATVPSPRTELLVKPPYEESKYPDGKKPCYMCALIDSGIDVKHTDVLILSQFLRSDGCMLPRRITGLCRRQQKRMSIMVAMAQKAGLMINITPANCKKDPKRRKDWKKFNTYYDENTIMRKRPLTFAQKFKRLNKVLD